MTTPTRTAIKVIAQVSGGTWPSTHGGWTTLTGWVVDDFSRGASQNTGSATLTYAYGRVKPADGTVTTRTRPADYGGQHLRLLKENPAGTVTVSGVTYSETWWGRVLKVNDRPDGGKTIDGGTMTILAGGVGAMLDAIAITEGREVDCIGTNAFDPGDQPAFNEDALGDRSAATKTINGSVVYVSARWRTDSAKWTASQVLHYLLSLHADVGGLKFDLAGQETALDYEVRDLRVDGKTLWQVICEIISPRRGLAFQTVCILNQCFLHVRSTSVSAVTVGTFTLPACSSVSDLTYDDQVWIGDLDVVTDHAGVADEIHVVGERPEVTLTLNITPSNNGALIKGWSSADETSWATGDQDGMDLGHVFRNFTIDPTWYGNTWGSSAAGLRNNRATATSASYGTLGYTGDRSYSGIVLAPNARALEAEAKISAGVSMVATAGTADAEAVVVLDWGSGASPRYENVSDEISLRVDKNPPGIWLGSGSTDAEKIKGWLDAGATILVTIAMREVHPLRVSWRRDATRPTDLTRKVQLRTTCGERIVAAGAVLGASADGASLITQSALLDVSSDLSAMRALLALMRTHNQEPHRTVRFTERCAISDDWEPAYMIGNVHTAGGNIAVNATITDVTYRRHAETGTWDTIVSTERIPPSLEAFL